MLVRFTAATNLLRQIGHDCRLPLLKKQNGKKINFLRRNYYGLSNLSDNPMYLHHGGWRHTLWSPLWLLTHPNTITPPTLPSERLSLSLYSVGTIQKPTIIAKTNLFRCSLSPSAQKQTLMSSHPMCASHQLSQSLLMENIICKASPKRELAMAITCPLH
jgi:hypothetical protein